MLWLNVRMPPKEKWDRNKIKTTIKMNKILDYKTNTEISSPKPAPHPMS